MTHHFAIPHVARLEVHILCSPDVCCCQAFVQTFFWRRANRSLFHEVNMGGSAVSAFQNDGELLPTLALRYLRMNSFS